MQNKTFVIETRNPFVKKKIPKEINNKVRGKIIIYPILGFYQEFCLGKKLKSKLFIVKQTIIILNIKEKFID